MKVGDLVKNTRVDYRSGNLFSTGIVVELPEKGDRFSEMVVAVGGNLELWCPDTAEVVDESR